jgi:hypothetical protein
MKKKPEPGMGIVPHGCEVDYQSCWNHLKNYMASILMLAKYNPLMTETERKKITTNDNGILSQMAAIEKMYTQKKRN